MVLALPSPAHDLPREQVRHRGQVPPTLVGADIGDISDPMRVRRGHIELPIQQVRRLGGRPARAVARTPPIAHLRP
jgi:hypothetical protein